MGDQAKLLIAAMESHKERAEKLLSAIADTGTIGGYQRVANAEQEAARRWRRLAVVSLLGMIG